MRLLYILYKNFEMILLCGHVIEPETKNNVEK